MQSHSVTSQCGSRTGYGKGIQGYNNSCYLDSLIMSLFYGSTCLDKIFLKVYANSPNTRYFQDVSLLLSKVVSTLRNTNYCRKELILHLRSKLAEVDSGITGEMEDVADFLHLLSKKGLSLDPFLNYTGGGTNFYHQIVLRPTNPHPSIQCIANLQHLLGESLNVQKISIQKLSGPLLAIKVPRTNGILVKYKGIFPPLNLMVSSSLGQQVLALQAVICLEACHYTSFLRSKKQWVFYDSMAAGGLPEVKRLPEMEKIMIEWSHQMPKSSSIDNLRLPANERNLYFRILTDIHMCIYVNSNVSKEFGFYNTHPTVPSQVRTQRRANADTDNIPSSSSSHRESSALQGHRRVKPEPKVGASSPISKAPITTVLPHALEHNETFFATLFPKFTEIVVSKFSAWKSSFVIFANKFSYDLNSGLDDLLQNGDVNQLKNNSFCRLGVSRGIEMSKSHKSKKFALESFVFALFSNTRRNDHLFCQIISPNSTSGYIETATYMQLVVDAMRYYPYLCTEQLISKLYSSLRIASSKVQDVADLVIYIFKDALPQSPFIKQGKRVSTFLHPIVIPQERNEISVTTKQLLMMSMQYQKVSFSKLQGPLFLSIQRNILGNKQMLLDLTIQTSNIFIEMPSKVLNLIGFISRDKRGNYKSYARYNLDQAGVNTYCWVSLGIRKDGKPEVKACPYIEPHILQSKWKASQRRLATYGRSQQKSEEISGIIKDIELLIYS